jgi:hypothetical protein
MTIKKLVMLKGTPGNELTEELQRCVRSLDESLKSAVQKNAQLKNGTQLSQEAEQTSPRFNL